MVNETLVDGWALCLVLQNCDASCTPPADLQEHTRGEKLVSLEEFREVLSKATKLDLGMKSLGSAGAKMVAPILGAMPALQTLILFANRLEAEGASALAATLAELTQLKTLSLGTNFVGAEGAEALSPAIGKLTALQTLLLGQNEIGVEGMRRLS
eukprot:CAMPEP_0177697156 /NCGR_PEP_ID=MMETSP0484_2-20121128/4365_1 /TAXON_ID=354590 /ORGANISM="Rhodomonas lens, Strain RHODO" /LENGTH=154 /DNA_ID=CAMNT_0019208179 /DNA_START=71 /DNA_END=531 /DNA_ORIENTATION=+